VCVVMCENEIFQQVKPPAISNDCLRFEFENLVQEKKRTGS
jgi:hypothetical protein